MGASSHTTNLNLPIYSNPAADTFDLTEWNNANNSIENMYTEVINARDGEVNLLTKINNIDTSLAESPKLGYAGTSITTWKNRFESNSINVKDFGAVGNGTTSDSNAIQNAIAYAKTNGINKVICPFSSSGYKVTTPIYVREGITLICEDTFNYRRGNFPNNKIKVDSDFVGDAIFILESNANIEGFVLYANNQKYTLTSYTDTWNTTPIGIQLGYDGYVAFTKDSVNYNVAYGNKINNISFVGIRQGIVQHDSVTNVEGLTVSNLRGMPLEIGINIKRAYDILRFENIHWNLNSYGDLLTGDTTQYYRKVATTFEVFKIGRSDSFIVDRCFVFGAKYFIHWYRDAFTGDSNNGGGVIINGSSCDCCHVAFYIERSGLNNFGVQVFGGFFTPIIKIGGSEQALVRFGTSATFNTVQISNVRAYGTTSSVFGDSSASNAVNYYIVWEGGSSNIISSNGCHFAQYLTKLFYGESVGNNNKLIAFGYVDNDVLKNFTHSSVTLQSPDSDSPNLAFEPLTGTKFELDSYGNAGSGQMRVILSGTTTWTFNESSGNLQFWRAGSGISLKSPDGVLSGVYSMLNTGEPSFGGFNLAKRVPVPSSATATGQVGQYACDSSYLYICTAINTWVRTAVATW